MEGPRLQNPRIKIVDFDTAEVVTERVWYHVPREKDLVRLPEIDGEVTMVIWTDAEVRVEVRRS